MTQQHCSCFLVFSQGIFSETFVGTKSEIKDLIIKLTDEVLIPAEEEETRLIWITVSTLSVKGCQ